MNTRRKTRKRIWSLAITLCMLTAFIPITANAEKYGDYLYYDVFNGTVSISECDTSATNIVIPSKIAGLPVTTIDVGAFANCTSLKSVTIPNSVKYIEGEAFYNCTSLKSVTIPNSVTDIGENVFSDCSSLTSVVLSETMTNIPNYTFGNCTSLTNITIPKNVISISSPAFYGCTNLANISVDSANESYCSVDGNLFSKNKTRLLQYAVGKKDTSYTIPDNVTNIRYYAFNHCKTLTSINIPKSVVELFSESFDACSSLTNINVDSANETYCSVDGNLFSKDKTELIRYAIGKKDTTYTVPDSVAAIEGSAFEGCASLKNIIIPDSVTSIGS